MKRTVGRDGPLHTAGGYEALASAVADLLDLPAVCVILGDPAGGAGAAADLQLVACTPAETGSLLALLRTVGADAIQHDADVCLDIDPAPARDPAHGRLLAVPFRTPAGGPGAVCAVQHAERTCTDTELRLVRELAMAAAREAAATDRARSLEALIETQRESIHVVGPDGVVLNVNPAGLRLLRRERLRDVLGAQFTDFIAPEYRAAWEKAQAAVIRGEERSLECRLADEQESLGWVAMHMVPFRDGRGRIAATLAVMADIDDRRVAEDAVVRYLSMLRGTLEATADGILVTDAAGSITAHNRRFCRKWGLEDDLAGDGLAALWARVDAALVAPATFRARRERLDAEPRAIIAEQLELSDGRIFEVISQPQLLEGRVAGRVWSFRDLTDRVAAERALRDSEEQFRSIIENTADIVYASDIEGRIIYISPSVERILGYRPADIIGRPTIELAHPDDHDVVWDGKARVRETGRLDELRVRARASDGTWRHLHLLSQRVTGVDGREIIISNARDVTELEQAQRELQASNETLQTILATMPLAVVGLDGDNIVRMWNRTAERMFGHEAAEIVGRPYTLVHEAHRARHEVAVRTTLDGSTIEGFESVHLRSDGTPIDVAIWASTVHGRESGEDVAVGLLADITERKRVEDRLRRNEQRFRALIENALDIIVMLDPNGTIRFGSPSGERLLGFGRGELKGISIVDLVHPDDLPTIRMLMATAPQLGDEARMVDVRVRNVDGTYRVLEGLGKTLVDDDGRPAGLIVNARDITLRKQLEEQLRQAQKMEAIGQFAGGVAHDFNNMLTAIKGFAALLEAGCDDDDERDSYVLEIRRAAERAASLTQQLLAFSRRQMLQPQVVDMNDVIAGMRAMLQRLIGADITLHFHAGAEVRPVVADPTQIEQVIMNLAVNARDAMLGGGTLEIITRNEHIDEARAHAMGVDVQEGEYVLLAVIDDGCGMDDTTRARIFDPFFTTKAVGKGTGLGLSTVYGIITQSGGWVQVHSRPGVGTRFEVYLPAAAVSRLPGRSRRGPVTAEPASGAVLLVDDEAGVRHVARRILERAGFTVTEAASADEAIARVRANASPFDALVTDVIMPGTSGPELAARLTSERPTLPVVVMSGYSDDEALPRSLASLGYTYLAKPFEPAALRAAVETALGSAAARSDTAPAGAPARP